MPCKPLYTCLVEVAGMAGRTANRPPGRPAVIHADASHVSLLVYLARAYCRDRARNHIYRRAIRRRQGMRVGASGIDDARCGERADNSREATGLSSPRSR